MRNRRIYNYRVLRDCSDVRIKLLINAASSLPDDVPGAVAKVKDPDSWRVMLNPGWWPDEQREAFLECMGQLWDMAVDPKIREIALADEDFGGDLDNPPGRVP